MMMVTIDKAKCDGDGTCVNMSECINCLTCVENCPQQAITVNEI